MFNVEKLLTIFFFFIRGAIFEANDPLCLKHASVQYFVTNINRPYVCVITCSSSLANYKMAPHVSDFRIWTDRGGLSSKAPTGCQLKWLAANSIKIAATCFRAEM